MEQSIEIGQRPRAVGDRCQRAARLR
jgi:hypothetical protein